MALFQKRKATQLLMVMVSHPGYAREFTAAEAEKLIAQGADVNAAVPAGGSPLGQTCIWGNVGVARTLLDHGADPKGIVREDIPPLHTAAMNGHDELVRLLVERGSSVNSRDKFGCTPLHSGVVPDSGRRNNIPETLISLGADPNLADENGQTPLARFAHTVQTLVGRPPFGNETQADRDRDDRQLTDDFRRLTALFSGR